MCRPQTQAVGEGAATQPAPGRRKYPARCLCSSHAEDGLHIESAVDVADRCPSILKPAESCKTRRSARFLSRSAVQPMSTVSGSLDLAIHMPLRPLAGRRSEPAHHPRMLAVLWKPLGSSSYVEVCIAHRVRVKTMLCSQCVRSHTHSTAPQGVHRCSSSTG